MIINNNATVTLIGNLGKDPEIRSNENGEFAYISIATQDSCRDATIGMYFTQSTVWHSVAVNNGAILERLTTLRKGSKVTVEATLDYRKIKAFVDGKERIIPDPKLTAISLQTASATSDSTN